MILGAINLHGISFIKTSVLAPWAARDHEQDPGRVRERCRSRAARYGNRKSPLKGAFQVYGSITEQGFDSEQDWYTAKKSLLRVY